MTNHHILDKNVQDKWGWTLTRELRKILIERNYVTMCVVPKTNNVWCDARVG